MSEKIEPIKILELDIETAPNKVYTWGLFNQNIGINQIVEPGYTLSFAAKWHGQKGIEFCSVYHDGMQPMLERAWALLEEADVVIHYNGTKFDIPTLNREFVRFDMLPPMGYKEVDLLRVVRQRFRFASNKLDYVAQELGLGAKTQHKGMPLWTGCMENDPKSWAIMKKYNIQDVKLTERLYERLLPWIKNHPNRALWIEDVDHPVCQNCGSSHVQRRGIERTKTLTYQRYRCMACGKPQRGRTRLEPAKAGVLV